MGARLNLKAPKGDDAMKAFNHWIKTGDNGGLRAAPEYKTDYNLVEGTQYQGQELVPTEIVNKIYALRDPNSIARAAGAIVIPVSAASVNVPYERTRQAVPVSTAEAAAYDILENQIFDKKAVTIVKYTRNVPITEELMEDAVVDFVPFVTGQLARAFAQLENTVFLTASTGAWYGSTKGLDFDSATAIAVAEIPELYHKLSQEYRAGSVWLGTKATEGYIRGLNTAYAFPFAGNGGWSGAMGDVNKGLGAGPLLNSPFYNWSGVEEIGAEHKSLMIGNFNAGYVILERRGMTVVRDTTTGIKEGLIYLLASCRIGGGVTIAEAFQHGLHPTG
jgi:HK97 family phage major capsid protein